MNNEKPWWATHEGTIKKCLKCNIEFKDYTKKLTHTICRCCWLIANDKSGFKNEQLQKDSQRKGRSFQCGECRGSGRINMGGEMEMCNDCMGTGMGEIEGSNELELGK